MVLATFAEKGPLSVKEEAHWRVLHVAGFVTVCEAFVGMDPYEGLLRRSFSEHALLVGKPSMTMLMGGFALAAARIGQLMKFDEC